MTECFTITWMNQDSGRVYEHYALHVPSTFGYWQTRTIWWGKGTSLLVLSLLLLFHESLVQPRPSELILVKCMIRWLHEPAHWFTEHFIAIERPCLLNSEDFGEIIGWFYKDDALTMTNCGFKMSLSLYLSSSPCLNIPEYMTMPESLSPPEPATQPVPASKFVPATLPARFS